MLGGALAFQSNVVGSQPRTNSFLGFEDPFDAPGQVEQNKRFVGLSLTDLPFVRIFKN